MEGADQLLAGRTPPTGAVGVAEPALEAATAGAPSVLAVVIARDPGAWFSTTLQSLSRQTYERLAVLVVDVANDEPLRALVARHCPGATVRTLADDPGGYGASVNAALAGAPKAALYLLCHDDVALDDDAVAELVTEVVRSNAAVVGPKLVDWDEPERLQHVGLTVDRLGAAIGVVDHGELDQEQHDAVTDVFALPGGCILIRADLFRTIGGFDDGITFRGDDVDLCWRAQLAGARVMVVPAAACRHRERLTERDQSDTYYLRLRHAMRSAWSCYSLASLLRVLPFAALLSIFEFVYSLVTGRFGHARAVVRAWAWNLRRVGEIRRRRAQIAAYREIDDGEVRALQASGSARVRAFVRGHGGDTDRLLAVTQVGRDYLASLRLPGTRYRAALLGVIAAIVAFGTRHLITRPLPAIGEFQPVTARPWDLLRDWWSGWHAAGGGTNRPLPTGHGAVGLLGLLSINSTGLLLKALVLAPLIIGPVGVWRFCRAFGSARASTAGAAMYALMPVAYDAIGRGSWAALVAYGAVPFAARGLARLLEVAPFTYDDPGASGYPRSFDICALGLVVAIASIATPFIAILCVLIALAYGVGSLLSGDERGVARLTLGTAGALGVAVLLHLPWMSAWLQVPRTWAPIAGPGTAAGGPLSFAELVRLDTGAFDSGYLGYVYGLPLVLAVLVAQNWRLSWAARAAALVLGALALQWAGERGWLPVALPDANVVLSVAAFGFAVGAALVAVAIEEDLPRYRLGWRQGVPLIALAAVLVTIAPLARASFGGRWTLPSRGLELTVGFLDEPAQREGGPFRVAWVGHRDVVPVSGATFDHDPTDGVGADGELVLALTDSRSPQFTDRWAPPQSDTALGVADSLRGAVGGETVRLGRELAIYSVRYIIVVEHRSPISRDARTGRPAPGEFVHSLRAQLDLERVEGVNDALQIYRNTAWVPQRALAAGDGTRAALASAEGPARWEGDVDTAGELRFSYPYDDRFRLTIDGVERPLVAQSDYGMKADALSPAEVPARAQLEYRTPISRRVLLVLQPVLWLGLIAGLLIWRDRLRRLRVAT